LLHQLDVVLIKPPSFHIVEDEQGNKTGEPIGVPVYLLFDILSNTTAAYDLFRKPAFNVALKTLLDNWGVYLSGQGSNCTLTDEEDGWFGSVGLASLEDKDRGQFNATYICPKPDEVNRGYQSWDEFFTRKINPDARKILNPEDHDLIISACESTPYAIEENVKLHDQFWLKAQKYSIYDMLGRDLETAKKFVGGTVYQAFLSPQDFHRWHAPIDGKITRAEVLPGTYYAALPDEGAEEDIPDEGVKKGDPYGALIRSQGWITQAATRAIIYIQADSEEIGLVGFIGVGMAEVSTCTLSVQKDQQVKKGDELGMFHFGGSSHTLIFEPKVKLRWENTVKEGKHTKVHSLIAKLDK
jgi:phosphatidylserine decarboxylase